MALRQRNILHGGVRWKLFHPSACHQRALHTAFSASHEAVHRGVLFCRCRPHFLPGAPCATHSPLSCPPTYKWRTPPLHVAVARHLVVSSSSRYAPPHTHLPGCSLEVVFVLPSPPSPPLLATTSDARKLATLLMCANFLSQRPTRQTNFRWTTFSTEARLCPIFTTSQALSVLATWR